MVDFGDGVSAKFFFPEGMRGRVPENGYFTNAAGEPAFAKNGVQVFRAPITAQDITDILGFVPAPSTGVNVVLYGADRSGTADSTSAFNSAMIAASLLGTFVVVPYGVYKIGGVVTWQNGVRLHLEGAVITGLRSSGGWSFRASGEPEDEIPITSPAVAGDRTFQVASTSGWSEGDYLFPKSAMRTLVAGGLDAPPEWQLGDISSPSASPFFADPPSRILTIDSATQVTLETPLIFPVYNTSGSGSRSTSTLQKINFMDGVRVSGWGTIIGNGTTVFSFLWCSEPVFDADIRFEMGAVKGASIRMESCLRHRVRNYPGTRHEGLMLNPEFDDGGPDDDHSDFNSYLDVGCWSGEWDVCDSNGSQIIDITFANGGHPSVCPSLTGTSMDSQYDGITFHQGCHKGLIKNFNIIRPRRSGIRQRSRGVTITGCNIIGPNQTLSNAGIDLIGWGAVDANIVGNSIDNFPFGIRSDWDTGVSPGGPAVLNVNIAANNILRATEGVSFTDRVTPNALDSKISISMLNLDQIGEKGVRIGKYYNYSEVSHISCGSFTKTNGFVVYNDSDAIGTDISHVKGALEATTTLVRTGNITDTATFPVADYPTNRTKIDMPSLRVTGAGIATSTTTGSFRVFNTDVTLDIFDAFRTIRAFGTGPYIVTVPLNSAVPFPVNGARIEILNGSTGNLTVAGSGITFTAPNGLVLRPSQRGFLYQGAVNTWWFFAELTYTTLQSSSPTAGIGYSAGAGGTITQSTSKSTTVLLNKVAGRITMNSANLVAGTSVSFTLTNSAIAATDYVHIKHESGGTVGGYSVRIIEGAGSAVVTVANLSGGDLAEALVLKFFVEKSTIS